jgi:hypothetical protein
MIQLYFELIESDTKTFVLRPYKTNEFFYLQSKPEHVLLQKVSEKTEVH